MKTFVTLFLLLFVASGCSSKAPTGSSEFPLKKWTTWTYSYETYEPSPSDPKQVIQAKYQLVETVTDTEIDGPYFTAHIKRDYQLIDIDPTWTGDYDVSQPGEYWYVVENNKVYESRSPVDLDAINPSDFLFDYDFPLSLSKAWCLQSIDPQNASSNKAITCEFVGKRMVTNQGLYETPAGRFEDCYELTDYFNGGNIIHWFCTDVGVVYRRFDHTGTRFGFEQELIGYSNERP